MQQKQATRIFPPHTHTRVWSLVWTWRRKNRGTIVSGGGDTSPPLTFTSVPLNIKEQRGETVVLRRFVYSIVPMKKTYLCLFSLFSGKRAHFSSESMFVYLPRIALRTGSEVAGRVQAEVYGRAATLMWKRFRPPPLSFQPALVFDYLPVALASRGRSLSFHHKPSKKRRRKKAFCH